MGNNSKENAGQEYCEGEAPAELHCQPDALAKQWLGRPAQEITGWKPVPRPKPRGQTTILAFLAI